MIPSPNHRLVETGSIGSTPAVMSLDFCGRFANIISYLILHKQLLLISRCKAKMFGHMNLSSSYTHFAIPRTAKIRQASMLALASINAN